MSISSVPQHDSLAGKNRGTSSHISWGQAKRTLLTASGEKCQDGKTWAQRGLATFLGSRSWVKKPLSSPSRPAYDPWMGHEDKTYRGDLSSSSASASAPASAAFSENRDDGYISPSGEISEPCRE